MKTLKFLVKDLDRYGLLLDITNDSESSASVGWHLVHSCLVISRITETLMLSDPANYKSKFNLKRFFVFATNSLPRGKEKAPSAVIPTVEITVPGLKLYIKQALDSIRMLGEAQKNQYFEHPVLGALNKKATIKFLEIHTNHHLKIVNEILEF